MLRLESGLDCLIFAMFARQRCVGLQCRSRPDVEGFPIHAGL